MKKYKFLNGIEVSVDELTCRGCFLENAKLSIEELDPIWFDDFFVIRQDAECPVPGFYIVSTRQHIHTIGDLTQKQASELGLVLNRLRQTMLTMLTIERIHVILEERKIEPHLHIWLLPLWPDIMRKYQIDPKIWNSNIYQYISLFSYEDNRNTILKYNQIMRDSLKSDPVLSRFKIQS